MRSRRPSSAACPVPHIAGSPPLQARAAILLGAEPGIHSGQAHRGRRSSPARQYPQRIFPPDLLTSRRREHAHAFVFSLSRAGLGSRPKKMASLSRDWPSAFSLFTPASAPCHELVPVLSRVASGCNPAKDPWEASPATSPPLNLLPAAARPEAPRQWFSRSGLSGSQAVPA